MSQRVPNYPVRPGGDGGEQLVQVEACPRRIRAVFGGHLVVDTNNAILLRETDYLPQYYLPRSDVSETLLEASSRTSRCPHKGEARYYHLVADERRALDAAWAYPAPDPGTPDLSDYLAFAWEALDHWYEEDEEVFVHPRDPYHRVDVLQSSRQVRVMAGDEVLAESRRPLLVFETGLPVRYYLPPTDVRVDRLRQSSKVTRCPYKGLASYWSLALDDGCRDDAVWSYLSPLDCCTRIAGHYCFDSDAVDRIEVEGRSGS